MKSHWLGGRRSVADGAKDWSVTRIVADSVKEIVASWSIVIDRREANWWRWGANRCELKCRDGPARSKLTTVRHEPLWAETSRQTDDGEAWTIASWSVATNWREVNQRQWGANRCELKHRDGPTRSESVMVWRCFLYRRQWGRFIWNFVYRRCFGTFCERWLGLELFVREWGSEITKQKGLNIIFSVKLIVKKFIFRHYLIPLATKISFITGYIHRFLLFVFSDDSFSSLFVTFSDEMVFVTNSILISTFNDESFRHKKLKLLVMK